MESRLATCKATFPLTFPVKLLLRPGSPFPRRDLPCRPFSNHSCVIWLLARREKLTGVGWAGGCGGADSRVQESRRPAALSRLRASGGPGHAAWDSLEGLGSAVTWRPKSAAQGAGDLEVKVGVGCLSLNPPSPSSSAPYNRAPER